MADSRYFYLSEDNSDRKDVYLSESESHHLSVVNRIKKGERVKLLDGRGGIYQAKVKQSDARKTLVEITGKKRSSALFRPDIAIPLLRANRMDIAVEKSAELGTRRIIPYLSERTIWRGKKKEAEKKKERLNRKVIAACKQSGQAYFPEVESIFCFNDLLNITDDYERVYLARRGTSRKAENRVTTGRVLGVIGPEGGLTENEEDMLQEKGAIPVSLGNSRLRSETAAICLVFYMRSIFE
ncbi:MAG TPA: 16S rRNA (uracil(1498)-N(3))-methyltransferase [Candidatus Krumholzibacteriaceae bacterium]|nr:16S rRNA (uracil(1498)-N(3))-methyltransferase [Candidatus Krumholzibacteriaceae bacterium]